jgi:ABC-type transport system involved in multi-copper enzyme maturation permease subunit
MAVRERSWRRWTGHLTPEQWRFVVIARFALQTVFSSRIFLAFYVLCLIPSLAALLAIYLSHNTSLLNQFADLGQWFAGVPDWIFVHLFSWQAIPAFLVAVMAAPPLIAADISHNGLVLILARPIRRDEYLVGKLMVLGVLLSPLTWIPAMLVFILQVLLGGRAWLADNASIAGAYLIGHWVWILVISLLGLAVSSWIRHSAIARGAIFAMFVVSGFVGSLVNNLTRSSVGDFVNLARAIDSVVRVLFGAASPSGLPVAANWATLVAVSVASLWVLRRKLRACEEIA